MVKNQNPKAKLQESSTSLFNQGKALLDIGKTRAARNQFRKMFEWSELKAEDFATVGKTFTDPKPGKTDITLDSFASKFLEQAKELGSKDFDVY